MRAARIIVLCVSAAVALFFGAASVARAATPPQLVFADEFNDGYLNTDTWATLTPWYTNFSAGELETYDPANVTVEDGQLHLHSVKGYEGGDWYTSGIVTSLARDKFSYGYFEIRAKIPSGRGIWPAFWLTNDGSLEIDGLEVLGDRPGRAYMTLHEDGKQIFQKLHDGPDLASDYHTYGIDWQPKYVRWYIDGVRRATYAHKMPPDPLWICLNTAIGGWWPGSPDASTQFPQSFDIDYVRVWDRKPGPPDPKPKATSAAAAKAAKAAKAAPGAVAPKPSAPGAPAAPGARPAAPVPPQAAAQAPASATAAEALLTLAVALPARVAVSTERAQTVPAFAETPPPSLSLDPAAYARTFGATARKRGATGATGDG